jgi:acyl-CoA reductase-like NAD-dependent aldehyde dehydrogenase
MKDLQSYSARSGKPYGAPLRASMDMDVDVACEDAGAAFGAWASSTGSQRALLLRGLADALQDDRVELVAIADEETALGAVRLNGELDRTAFQLRRFADLAERGMPFTCVDDPAVPGLPPVGHPAMVRMWVPLGPVAMFSASNFPLAFSVLGGDTASALAAGCPVVVKAHSGHLQLSGRVHALAQGVLRHLGLSSALIGMVQGPGSEVGVRLIRHPAIAAGAFTGSTRGGAALQAQANARPRPIPFYGELGSINPVVALPGALVERGAELAQALAASIASGAGQFCTSPGVIVLIDDPVSDAFADHLTAALGAQKLHPMLTSGMRRAFEDGITGLTDSGARVVLKGQADDAAPSPFIAEVEAAAFIANEQLREEVFGPASLIVRAASVAQAIQVLEAVGGSLTVTLWGVEDENDAAVQLVSAAQRVAGRVLFSGVPTGVAVTAAQQHGGPWPSSTQPMTTSVGDAAMNRFLRPVALQDAPAWLLAKKGQPC